MISRFLSFFVFLGFAFGAKLPFAHAIEGARQGEIQVASQEQPVTLPRSPSIIQISPAKIIVPSSEQLNGWDHLYTRLTESGLDPVYVTMLLSDKRMPAAETLYFGLSPKEPRSLYRKTNSARNRRNALAFYRKHQEYFELAKTKYGVSPSVVAAILQVESSCGAFTGRSSVFYRLARLAAASDPNNVDANFERLREQRKNVSREDVERRAQWLEQTFLPHTAATIVLASVMGVHPLDVQGSSAGAVGMPQFLPGNVLLYGIDADESGDVDLTKPADAILSLANYLHNSGWKRVSLPLSEQRKVVWQYNHSDAYVDAVVRMASDLRKTTG